MNFESLRQVFRPLFGLERQESTSKFLSAILVSALVINFIVISSRWFAGATFLNSSTLRLFGILFILQILSFFAVKRGYVNLASHAFVILAWIGVTYQAWSADGVRDAAIYLYVLIILVAALLTTWHIPLVLSVLSIICIWTLAITEARGLRDPHIDQPLDMARDLTAIFSLLFFLVYLVVNTIRQSLDAVREGEEKFRRIFHLSPVAIAIASIDEGRLVDANEAYWKLTGVDRSTAIGKTTAELGIWSKESEHADFVKKLKEQKSLHNPSYKITDGAGIDHMTLAFYELIEFEKEPSIMAMFYDVTEQKNAQLALQASEQKYRNFIEQSMEGIWFLAFDLPISISLPAADQVDLIYKTGYISESNDVLAHMYGYSSSEEMRGVRLMDLQAETGPNEISSQATLQLVKEGYRSGNRETREQKRTGEIVAFLNNAVGVIEDNHLVGLWGTQLDITALKNTEDALRLSEARTRALLDAIPDMIFEFKSDGTILQFISSRANTPLIPPEQFLGKKIMDVLPASVASQTTFAIERVLDSGRVHAFEYQLFQDDENRTFEARITPLSPDTVLAIVRDVSLQKWILSEREKLINELELKNAELERFTYTASHDLKSPLITIKGFLGFLREDAQNGNLKRLETDIQRISDAADKMQRLLNDLLELSRIGRLLIQPQPVDLKPVISEVLELLYGQLHAGNIRVSIVGDLPVIYADRARLLEVLQNLVDNAAKFMGDQPDPHIEIGEAGESPDGLSVLFVRDNGIGVDPRFKDRIFGLFDKLDPRTDGTGIGLALVKRIIEFHGGRIWVESEVGHGAAFYFTLPHSENPIPNSG